MTGGGDMSERDPAIRLFGRNISLPECQIPASSSHIPSNSAPTDAKPEVEKPCADNSEQLENSSDLKDSSKVCEHTEEKNEPKVNPKPVEDKMETSSTNEDKMFKKPDKIQQCPRCNSLDTKFCYFNNYNVNQPRHFCKNCQRYWTAGGTMRNVPVGAGRRRNKHLSSQYRHIMVASDGIQTTKLETTDSSGHQLVSTLESSAAFRSSTDNGTILKFGPDAPLCDSVDSILNIRDQKSFDKPCINCVENGEELSLCGSSVTNASSAQGNELSELTMQRDPSVSNEHSTSNRLHSCPVPPWVFPCNPGWNNVASMAAANHNQSSTPVQWYPPPAVTVPGICPPNIPLQFVAAPYWSGTVWAAGTGTVSIGSNGCLSPSSSTSNSCCSGNGSPSLGKHSREEKSDKCVLVPKTPRIDDPNEASRSPIWATLGINAANRESISKVSILRKLEAKEEGKDRAMGVSRILEAIPAAISGAHAVHEST